MSVHVYMVFYAAVKSKSAIKLLHINCVHVLHGHNLGLELPHLVSDTDVRLGSLILGNKKEIDPLFIHLFWFETLFYFPPHLENSDETL